MKMKKVLAAALSLACASTLFAATAVTASAADKKEVVIWDYFETDAQKQMMQSLIDEFNASQDEYEASHVYVPFADYEKQLTPFRRSFSSPRARESRTVTVETGTCSLWAISQAFHSW